MSYLLGIDVGTGGTRALVIDESGRIVSSATHDHVPFASPHTGWAEQDPVDWWHATSLAVRAALAKGPIAPEAIKAVGFSGQMHGSTLLDARDEVVRPALLWCDQRTDAECRAITEQVGAARLIELTANPALTGFTLPKLVWVRTHEPDLWNRVRSVLLPKDYVRFRLTGDKATDVADASGTLLFDVRARRWSAAMLEAMRLDASLMPRAFESPEITGTVSEAGAAATGLRKGTPVVAGGGDQAAGAVGMGIVRPGAVSATIGTSGVVFAATDHPALDTGGRVHTFCHAIPGRWHVMGVTQARRPVAALVPRSFRRAARTTGATAYDRMTDEAASVPAGSDGVIWAPYLMGERTPHLDPDARGGARRPVSVAHARACRARGAGRRRVQPQGHVRRSSSEMGVPVSGVRARRRGRAVAALASDPGRRLRLPCRDRRSRRRRRLRRGAAGWRRRRRLAHRRRRLRRRGQTWRHRLRCHTAADQATMAGQYQAYPRASIPRSKPFAAETCTVSFVTRGFPK